MADAASAFPHPLYQQHVLTPFFQDAKTHYYAPMLAANRAHVVMLCRCDIITRQNAVALLEALHEVEALGLEALTLQSGVEDLFFAIEGLLIELAGADYGGNLQLARSRNDLGYALTRLALRPVLLAVGEDLVNLRASLHAFARAHLKTLMPGYTHTQPAQPTTMAHYVAGVLAGLERDMARLRSAYATNNQSPLGAAALTGNRFPHRSPTLSADLLGFDGVMQSTYDSIGASDNLTEAAGVLSTLGVNLSRFTRDLLFWATQESGAIRIDEGFIQISSIMPQKRNPVVLEHLRARISRMLALAQGIVLQCHNIPYGDTQDIEDEILPPLFGSLETAAQTLQLYAALIDTLQVNVDQLRERAGAGFTTVTELADTLVRECGLPFRGAHSLVAALVSQAHEDGLGPDELTSEMLSEIARRLGVDVNLSSAAFRHALDPQRFVEARSLPGGAAPSATKALLAEQEAAINTDRAWLLKTETALATADADLWRAINELGS